MKLRDAYSNYFLVAGLVLLVLGLGNWVVGAMETRKYQGLVHRTAQTGLEEKYAIFQQLDQQKNEEVLRRITQDREKFNAARVKLDFFYVVLSGGQLLFVLGLLVTFCALIQLIRQDAFSKMTGLAAHAFKAEP